MTSAAPLPIVIIGAGQRVAQFYLPLLLGPLAERFQVLGLISRGESRVADLARTHELRWSLSLEDARIWGARGAVVAVSPDQNHQLAAQLLDLQLPGLLETPLALSLPDSAGIESLLSSSGLPFQIAEQNTRHLPALLWRELVTRGVIGELRAVTSDGAGYRYHATAVARRLFGSRAGKVATGQRVFTKIDLGRGVSQEPLYSGTIRVDGDGLFHLRASEIFYFESPGWIPGGWQLLGDEGAVHWNERSRPVVVTNNQAYPFEWQHNSAGRLTGLRVEGIEGLEVVAALPGEELTDDQQAVARCLLDWHSAMEGVSTPTAWSPDDAHRDLVWVASIERSAQLGGAPIALEAAGIKSAANR